MRASSRISVAGPGPLWLLTLFLSCLSGCAGVDDAVDSNEAALTAAEQREAEVQQDVEDAACYCEAWLLIPAYNSGFVPGDLRPKLVDPPVGDAELSDARLKKYADAHRSNGVRTACGFAQNARGVWTLANGTGLSASSPHGMLPVRALDSAEKFAAEQATNACVSTETAWSALSRAPETANDSFCRADFNYCIAQQLRIKAESLARSPSSRETRDAILAETRTRFALSGNVLANEFASIPANHCGAGATPPSDGPCVTYQTCSSYSFGYRIDAYSASKQVNAQKCTWECTKDPLLTGGHVARGPGGNCERVCTDTPQKQCSDWRSERLSSFRSSVPSDARASDGSLLRDKVSITSSLSSLTCSLSGSVVNSLSGSAPPCTCIKRAFADTPQCERITSAYGEKALARMGDIVGQLADLTVSEATSRMAASDSVSPATSSGGLSYGEKVWGAGSGRMSAAMTIAGAPDDLTDAELPAYATTLLVDDKPRQMLALMEAFSVTLPYQICADDTRSFLSLDVGQSAVWYARILTAVGEGARRRFNLPATSSPADAVRQYLHLSDADVASALTLLKAQIATLDLDYSFVATDETAEQGGCKLARFSRGLGEMRQRSPLPLVATLARPGRVLSHWYFDGGFLDGWTTANADTIRPLGAANQLHLLRKNLLQLRDAQSLGGAQLARLTDAVSVIGSWVGDSWTEYQTACLWGCDATWRATGSVLSPGAELGLVANAESATCLLQGHMPGRTTPCAGDAFAAVHTSTVSATSGWAKRPAIQFTFTPPSGNSRLFVMERLCATEGQSCHYRLIDVIDSATYGTVHTVGGELNALLERVLAKKPNNPAEPLVNALGLPSDGVPTMSFGFTGQVVDDWYKEYATDSASTTKEVTQRLNEQFNNEVQLIQQEQTASFQLQNLALAQQDVLTQACGDSPAGNCAVSRVPEVSLLELNLVSAPGDDPGGAEPGQSCLEFLASFDFHVPDDDIKPYIEKNLKAALRCTRWATLVLASATKVYDLPVSIRDQLIAGAQTATFPELGGKVRDEHLSLFTNLRKLGIALRQFDTTYQVALLELDNALQKIDDDEPGWWKQFACYSTKILTAAATAAVVYSAVAAASASTGGLAAAALVAMKSGALFQGGVGVVGAVDGLVNISECGNADAAQADARAAFAKVLETMEALRRLSDDASTLVMEVAHSDTVLDALEASVAIADARSRIEAQLALTNAAFDPAWRFMQTQRALDTRRYLRDAQAKLFAARRASEFRTGEDLRFISSGTSYSFGAPSGWANAVYALDFPAGNSGGAMGALIASELDLYARRIVAFMQKDYATARPFRLTETLRVVRLSELLSSQVAGGASSLPMYELMSFRCQDGPDWLVGGRASSDSPDAFPCEEHGGVVEARVSFSVSVPYQSYYAAAFAAGQDVNYRISSVALNLLGGALKNCLPLSSPYLCDDNKDIPYSLRQSSRVWVENFDHNLRAYDMTPGVVQADARTRDEPITTANLSLIQPFEARQLKDRPLAGDFTISFQNPPNYTIHWENLEDIQLIVRFEHWTPQN